MLRQCFVGEARGKPNGESKIRRRQKNAASLLPLWASGYTQAVSQTSLEPLPVLEIDVESALFGRGGSSPPVLGGAVVTFYLNERPLQGLSGRLDWRFHGAFSRYLKAGAFSGAEGECVYLPLRFPLSEKDKTYHLILIGAGESDRPGLRHPLGETILRGLKKNLESLRLLNLGISRSDFGDPDPSYFEKNFKGAPVWIAP